MEEIITMNITRTYVPMEEKIDAIMTIMAASQHPNFGFYLPLSVAVYRKVFDYKLYTDVEIDEEKPVSQVYDELMALDDALYEGTASEDIAFFHYLLDETISKYEKYQTSALGILESLKENSSELSKNAEEILGKIKNSKEDLSLVNEVVTKLG